MLILSEYPDSMQTFSNRAPVDLASSIEFGRDPPMLRSLFCDHPASVDETYTEHMAAAGCFALRLFVAGVVCSVHAVLPFLFVKTGSTMIAELHDRMVTNRRRLRGTAAGAQTAAPR